MTAAPVKTRLAADRDQVEAFVDALFRHADEGTVVALRGFPDDGAGPPLAMRDVAVEADLAMVAKVAVGLAESLANIPRPAVFCPPIATFHPPADDEKLKANAASLANGLALSVECDARPAEALRKLTNLLGRPTVVARSGGLWTDPETGEVQDKLHLHWRLTEPTRDPADHQRLHRARDLAARLVGGDPTNKSPVHPIRWPGSWHRKAEPRLALILELNADVELDLGGAVELLEDAAGAAGVASPSPPPARRSNLRDVPILSTQERLSADPLDVAAALAAIPNGEAVDWDQWNRVGMATWSATGGSAAGFAAFMAWSERSPKFDADATRARWQHYATSPPDRIGAGTLIAMAKDARPDFRKPTAGQLRGDQVQPDQQDDAEAPHLSEDALALAFTAEHGHELRYVAGWGKWFVWDGCRWAPDVTLSTFTRARAICREASGGAKSPKLAAKLASAATVAAVVKLATADPVHARRTGDWDQDPWTLNTPGGMVDLRTGDVSPCDPAAACTKATAVAPDGDCPAWLSFLHDVTGGDAEVQDYLQRVVGYCLTGSIREHALFFAHGPGGNGKGVFLNAVQGLLGDYATVASMDTFTVQPGDRHPADMAMLRGARLVTAQETEEGRRWAESKVKALTGGDPITARFMRQDFFTFQPAFKLFVVGNHRPAIRNVDEAMRRRLHLIPFTFRPAVPDRNLPERLREEWPGILRWAIEGTRHWLRAGLNPPAAVLSATASYFETEDAIGRWLDERCELSRAHRTAVADLFADWRAWTEAAGEHTGSLKRFSANLDQRGFERMKTMTGATFIGLCLRPDTPKPWVGDHD